MDVGIVEKLPSMLRPAWPDEGRFIVQAPVLQRMLDAAPLRGDVLNAGAGEGLFAPLLTGAAITSCTHVDLEAPVAIARLRPGDVAVAASLTDLPFADASFDTVLCTEVLEHIPDDAKAARELGRVLRPNGMLVASVPTPPAPPDDLHVREGYTLGDLDALLRAAGLTIEAHEYCFHMPMRALVRGWQWQHRAIGRNVAPRAVVRGLAHLDRAIPFGKPWDLVVRARRTG